MIEEEVPEALNGERLDRFVAMVSDCSRSAAAKYVTDGRVTLNGRVMKSGKVRVETGQRIVVDNPAAEVLLPPEADSSVAIDVVHEDDHIIVVDKAHGQVVHAGAGNTEGTMVNGLLARFPEIAGVGDPMRPGIVHRLDKGTTGLLAVARTQAAYDGLVEALSFREVTRQYITLCWGVVENDRGLVDAAIGRSGKHRTRMAVTTGGKEARTHYEVVSRRTDDPQVSLLTCRLETGRTHQIRVHLAAIGHPVVGDDSYRGARLALPFERPALHAEYLAFTHPVTEEFVEFRSPRPRDFADLVRSVLPGD